MDGRAIAIAVSALAVGMAAGTALCWVSFLSTTTPTCAPPSGDTGFGAGPLTFSKPVETTIGADHWYNFTLQAAGGGLLIDNLAFQVQGIGGQPLGPGPEWNLSAFALAGDWLGSYAFVGTNAGTWISGGDVPLAGGQVYSLLTDPGNVSGDAFVVQMVGSAGGCPVQGSVWTPIP